MGQELLEDTPCVDMRDVTSPGWEKLNAGYQAPTDFLHFVRGVIALRRRQPALRGERMNLYHVHNANRVLAFHRWLDGQGRDIVVLASLNESTFWSYQIGFPGAGRWLEVFNSDLYDHWSNPNVVGNGGFVSSDGPPMHGLPASAWIIIPANGLLVFARDGGD
jgi:1,4-alpha-glucan branching enzyme